MEEKTLLVSGKEQDPEESTNAFLIVIKGGAVGKKYKVSGSMIVGRSSTVDIYIDDPTLSRKHAEIILDASGKKATIHDLDSLNGTKYKGNKIKNAEIVDGEQIEFGTVACKFVTDINAEGELLDFASIDDMTKTYNKRYFNETMNSEYKKSLQVGTPISLIMFDIDKFKKINDTFGHSAGDYILKTLCATVAPLLDQQHTFARIGGEEFAIVMPGATKDEAARLAELIRIKVEANHFLYNTTAIPVTISLGVCQRTEDIKDLNEFIIKTDSLLYLAKNTGRNRVCS